jgi:hypothetical protein
MINGIPDTVVSKFMETGKHREGDCVIWEGVIGNGYGKINIGAFVSFYAHRVAYALSHGSEAKNHVLHSCDARACVNPSHLRDGTHQENMQDKIKVKKIIKPKKDRVENPKTLDGFPRLIIKKFIETEKVKDGDCLIWKGRIYSHGYGVININGHQHTAHRIAYVLANGIEAKNSVLHSCDKMACVNPNHLKDGTQAENMRDMAIRNRASTIFTESDIIKIRADTRTQTEIANDYNVHQVAISAIKLRKTWKHVA